MVKLGEIQFVEDAINLELSEMVENNLTVEQSEKLEVLWQEMATLMELSLKQMVGRV